MRKNIGLTLLVLALGISAQAQVYLNVLKFGVKNDSSKLATEGIKKAIATAVKQGGGTIYFPAGKYKTGPIELKSNITIFIDAGAELHFTDDFDAYLPMVPSRWEGTDVINFSPLFYAYKAENIAIKGRGLIDGHGKKWWAYSEVHVKNIPTSKWQEEFKRLNKDVLAPDLPGWIEKGFLRPPFIQPMFCKNVQIEGITIKNSPFWTVNPEFCDNVTIHGVTIENPHSPNTDGINPESCSNVHISNCHISVGDDCITIKSGKDRSGRKRHIPAENYTITNCTMLSGHGGVVIGSEMSGGVKKIVISNCIFDGTDRGIRIKTARGRGGVVEDIRVDNIVMKNIKEQAIVLDMQYAKTTVEPISERTPIFRNIHFSNITAQGNQAGYLNGLEELPIEDISFQDLNFDTQSGFVIKNSKNIQFDNVRVNTERGAVIKAENSQQISIKQVLTNKPHTGVPILDFSNLQQVSIQGNIPLVPSDIYLKVSGEKSGSYLMGDNNFKNVKTPIQTSPEVPVGFNQ